MYFILTGIGVKGMKYEESVSRTKYGMVGRDEWYRRKNGVTSER